MYLAYFDENKYSKDNPFFWTGVFWLKIVMLLSMKKY